MRKYIVIYLLFTPLYFNLSAKELKVPIKTLINQIKSAKVENRRNLMNQLKLRLREMNKESRKKTMIELKKSFNGKRRYREHGRKREHKQHPRYRQIQHNHHRGHR